MFGRSELLFTVKLRPYQSGPADILDVPLIFFSAFERLRPDPQDEMQRIGDIIRLYEPGPYPALEPIMHVGFLTHVLCRAPLIPCYLNGNPTPTAPHGFEKSNQLHHGRTDSRPGSGDGSRLYEVNMWMWRFGRGMPRSMSVSDAERLRAEYKSNWRSMGEKSKKRIRDREQDE